MKDLNWRAKVDPKLAAAYDRAAAEGQLDTAVGVLVRVDRAADVALPGLALGAQSGEVATATVILAHLPTVVAADTISYIELAGTVMWDNS